MWRDRSVCRSLRTLLTLSAIFLASCGLDKAQLLHLPHTKGVVDLRQQIEGQWEKVCILMPYANHGAAKQVLGFSYFPGLHSSIDVLDDRTLLLAISGQEVLGAFEVLRENVDFTRVGAGCYARSKAAFKYEEKDGGWHELSNL